MAGIFIHALCNENKHVLASEGGKEIFNNILKPLAYMIVLMRVLMKNMMIKITCLMMMKLV